MTVKPNKSAKDIGARFRSARALVPNLNRKSFCERHGINRYTMQSWENGLHVSKGKNVERFIDALAREGVYCTAEWLIDGIGEGARSLIGAAATADRRTATHLANRKLEQIILSLQEVHREHGEELIAMRVEDDAMAPKFMAGDMVYGRKLDLTKENLHQKYCIVELSPDRLIARKILKTKDAYVLMALSDRVPPLTLAFESQIYEVVWHLLAQGLTDSAFAESGNADQKMF